MPSAVRNRIASYEAHNKQKAHPTNDSVGSAAVTSHTRTRDPRAHGSQEGGQVDERARRERSGSPSTAEASQNRITRIKQEQRVKEGKANHSNSFMVKRRQVRERRMMQVKSAESPPSGAPIKSSPANQYMSSPPRVSQGAGVGNLSRRGTADVGVGSTKCSTNEEIGKKSQGGKSNEKQALEGSPGGNRGTRMSKIQRMQKIKGYDHVKRGYKSEANTANSQTKSNTSDSHNDTEPTWQPQYGNQSKGSTQTPGLGSPGVARESMGSGGELVLNQKSSPYLQAASTASGTDVCSENNGSHGILDPNVDQVTDDDATLTSVRRVMGSDTRPSSSGKSEQPLTLTPEAYRDDDVRRPAGASSRPVQASIRQDAMQGDGVIGEYPSTQYRGSSHTVLNSQGWGGHQRLDSTGRGGFQTTSSSDYDTDGDSRHSRNLDGPSRSQGTDVNDFFLQSRYSQGTKKVDDDEHTFDYGDRDDESNGSALGRRRFEADRLERKTVVSDQELGPPHSPGAEADESTLINKDDVEHYSKAFDTPAMKVSIGVAGVVAVGCLALGPVALLAGAATVGVGVSVMQIPPEERSKMQAKAQKAVDEIQERALDATEKLSSSCAVTLEDAGVSEHIPNCFSLPGEANEANLDQESTKSEKKPPRSSNNDTSPSQGAPPDASSEIVMTQEDRQPVMSMVQSTSRTKSNSIACFRSARILPASQIHGLDPAAQPRAWLDIVANVNTSISDRNEAMEEILILAKDKQRARILLDEGILDSIIWTLDRYFEKKNAFEMGWANRDISYSEELAARLAATCCVTLGKTHCAAIHTEGDLQLMSLYERGTVPEERQVAQMLHEIPHHVRITKTSDPTIIDPKREVFTLRQLSLPQAEEVARSIKGVADGPLGGAALH